MLIYIPQHNIQPSGTFYTLYSWILLYPQVNADVTQKHMLVPEGQLYRLLNIKYTLSEDAQDSAFICGVLDRVRDEKLKYFVKQIC